MVVLDQISAMGVDGDLHKSLSFVATMTLQIITLTLKFVFSTTKKNLHTTLFLYQLTYVTITIALTHSVNLFCCYSLLIIHRRLSFFTHTYFLHNVYSWCYSWCYSCSWKVTNVEHYLERNATVSICSSTVHHVPAIIYAPR